MKPIYVMQMHGFTGVVKKGEKVTVKGNAYGVANVETDDGREDWIHVDDIERVER